MVIANTTEMKVAVNNMCGSEIKYLLISYKWMPEWLKASHSFSLESFFLV